MDEILERLLRQHPEAAPIFRSKYIPDCHVGRGRVWRAGQPVVTDTLQLYPSSAVTTYSRLGEDRGAEDITWAAR